MQLRLEHKVRIPNSKLMLVDEIKRPDKLIMRDSVYKWYKDTIKLREKNKIIFVSCGAVTYEIWPQKHRHKSASINQAII